MAGRSASIRSRAPWEGPTPSRPTSAVGRDPSPDPTRPCCGTSGPTSCTSTTSPSSDSASWNVRRTPSWCTPPMTTGRGAPEATSSSTGRTRAWPRRASPVPSSPTGRRNCGGMEPGGGGSPPWMSRSRRGVSGLEVEGWVSPARLSELYRHARALVIPSVWPENAPLVAVEALAWGTPLLTARRGGLEELLYGGTAGRSAEPTADALGQAVEAFEGDDLPNRLRPGARAAYEANHRPEAYLDRYMGLLRDRDAGPHTVRLETVAAGESRVPLLIAPSSGDSR